MTSAVRTALVTGVAGQDGVLLARHLRGLGRRVVGTVRPGAGEFAAMRCYLDGVVGVDLDVRDTDGFAAVLADVRPDEVYNLAGFSSVGASWDQPDLVMEVNGAAVERMLSAIVAHQAATGREVRFFQASSAEELGSAAGSPYARSKARARAAVVDARERHGLFACAATLFNHESPLRAPRFVTRKITRAAAEIALGRRSSLALGNLAVTRDWGAAREYVAAMAAMLALDEPADLTLATGVPHTLEDLLVCAFDAAGLGDPWSYVSQDPALVRPADSDVLVGDPEPAAEVLGWRATVSFQELVAEMVAVDLRRVESGVEEDAAYLG
ncbi:GDP-mannose 4,6-dehydratase [Nocardioides ferulae]|uniref:GDP-mannose 4,6-dehydratase n=1 Tax=Nocardioides ferulae TaxID=2340821 RepID=UPI0013DE1943|nr:GDP-mannose 4,6-dehydratase [Nocardioides ferulae]